MKKIIILLLIIASVIIIYFFTLDRKTYIVSLNNNYGKENDFVDRYVEYIKSKNKLEKYVNEFEDYNSRITDTIRMIEDNKELQINKKKQTIQNALIKADLIIISVGLNDLNYKINFNDNSSLYDYVDNLIEDMKILFTLLRSYSKEKIAFIGLNNSDIKYNEIYNYMNDKIDGLCNNYKIDFIDINSSRELTKKDNENIYMKLIDKY